MFGIFSKKQQHVVGVDIGSYSTKIVGYSHKHNCIQKSVIEPTPEKLIDSNTVVDKEGLGDFINSCAVILDSSKDISVVTGVSGSGVITKKIEMPHEDESSIQEYLPLEAEQYLPYDISDVELDYEILKGLPLKTDNSTSILLVAVLKTLLGDYEEAFSHSILQCKIIDANVFALFNIFEKNYDLQANKNYLLLDIGFKGSNLVAVVNKQAVFTRYMPAGGDFYTKKIENSMGLSYEEAEELKKTLTQDASSSQAQDLLDEVQNSINPLFCEEVSSIHNFYANFFPDNPISDIYITGGGSQIPYLTEALESHFKAKTEILNPFASIKLGSDLEGQNLKAFLAVSSGLALRS